MLGFDVRKRSRVCASSLARSGTRVKALLLPVSSHRQWQKPQRPDQQGC